MPIGIANEIIYKTEFAGYAGSAMCAMQAVSATAANIGADQFAPTASRQYESSLPRTTEDGIISL